MLSYNIDLYSKYRPLIKNSDILEWRSETLLGKTIRFITKYDVNHTSQVITFECFYKDKPKRIYTLEALSHGIELNLLSRRLKEFKGKVYWLPLKDKYDSYRNKISRYGLERIGIPYDYSSIKKIFFKALFFGSYHIKSSIDRLYCSEYIYDNGIDSGLPKPECFEQTIPVPGEMFKTNWYKDRVLIHNSNLG